ncbi:K+-transporting ATPase ATPase C chain [Microlunatus panaciterrae]|uniref:Potassium-transporting ATPase KdpC subunit n=2 Tax=Microlunatus panaciterrae TaxID=400768 RepID=A0ABS2RHT4_9ACTN|nr:K(+)-transporting ATPase subunit C [Microlunatus panaciterrae]MBM7798569.1 K+-transporting ATPase ATPase C chain [Microlunatus panaciterrae]
MNLLRQSLAGLRVLAAFTLLLGLAYPLLITGVAQLGFPSQANGSLVSYRGAVVGSSFIGQRFTGDRWFLPRPSAAGSGYDPTASSGSNLGPNSLRLTTLVRARRVEIARREGVSPDKVPADAVTASGSGLDPAISPAYAQLQAARVARARRLPPAEVERLVAAHTQRRMLGILGEPAVNVLELNLALERLS